MKEENYNVVIAELIQVWKKINHVHITCIQIMMENVLIVS